MAKTRQGQASSSATQSVPSRLPSTRERRPALAALALLLIVGGALASGWLALRAGDRADFLRVSGEVAQGQKIEESDLETVSLPESFDGAIPASKQSSIEGQYATTRLLPDTILTSGMTDESSGVADNTVQFSIGSESSSLVKNLPNGANIAVYLTGDNQTDAIRGQVVEVSQGDGDSGIGGAPGSEAAVLVSVDASCGTAVSKAQAEDQIGLGLIGEVDDAVITDSC